MSASDDQLERGRLALWLNLEKQLNKLINHFDVPRSAIAEGLGISRQKLDKFLEDSTDGLNINRYSILQLWEHITDTENVSKLRISQDKKEKRRELKRLGPNAILKACEYQPISDLESIEQENSQGKRILNRLDSDWIIDDEIRSDITNNILDQILDLGRAQKNLRVLTGKQAENWPIEELGADSEQASHRSYVKHIRLLTKAGKAKFSETELYELYQSIHDHRLLKHPNYNMEFSVNDCQFEILSSPIIFDAKDISLTKPLREYSAKAEKKLTDLLVDDIEDILDEYSEEDYGFQHVLQAVIECKFRFDNGEVEKAIFRNSSTATHNENMLEALKNGLCYPLDIRGFYVRVVGSTEKSLARVTINLAESDSSNLISHETNSRKIFQGWWVDSSIVLGISKATVDALKRWIGSSEVGFDDYFKISIEISGIEERLFRARDTLYENNPSDSSYSNSRSKSFHSSDFSLDKIVNDIDDKINALDVFLDLNPRCEKYFRAHLKKLKRQKHLARLMRIHSSLIRSSEASPSTKQISFYEIPSHLDEIEHEINQDGDEYGNVLLLYLTASRIIYNFTLGERSFNYRNQWRFQPEYSIDQLIPKLKQYIQSISSIDFDVYLYVGKIHGVLGFLNFYLASSRSGIEESYEMSIMASHYASRIGHFKWSAYWLSYASRAFCALGDIRNAELYVEIALNNVDRGKGIIDFTLDASPQYFSWPMANVYLARGEILIKKKKNFKEALKNLCEALKISIYFDFKRLAADSYYNLSRLFICFPRSTRQGGATDLSETLEEVKKELDNFNAEFIYESCPYECLTSILKEFDKPPNEISDGLSEVLKEKSKQIWSLYISAHDEKLVHPIIESLNSNKLFDVEDG